MALNLNKVILAGNLGSDPELRFAANGDAIATFSIATREGKNGDETEWHRCVTFKQPANYVGEYLKKGDNVYVEGTSRTRTYETKAGEEKTSHEIRVFVVKGISSKRVAVAAGGPSDINPEDIPF